MTAQPLDQAAIVAALLREHRFLSKGARDCKCGWSGGQMWPTTPHEQHLGEVIAERLAAELAAERTKVQRIRAVADELVLSIGNDVLVEQHADYIAALAGEQPLPGVDPMGQPL